MINVNKAEMVCKGLECCKELIVKKCDDPCPYIKTLECKDKLCADALSVIRELQAKQPIWISVNEGLPKEKENPLTHDFQEVLCFCDFGGIPKRTDVRAYKFGNGHFYHGPQVMDGIVTHWQYYPEPPKEGE